MSTPLQLRLISLAKVVGNGVSIRPSLIENAGSGLFADQFFPKGSYITEYQGPILDRRQAEMRKKEKKDSHIRCLDMQHSYIDGYKIPEEATGKGGASFANDASYKGSIRRNNAIFKQIFDEKQGRSRVFIEASRDIQAGSEIYIPYGRIYWKKFEENSKAESELKRMEDDSPTEVDTCEITEEPREKEEKKNNKRKVEEAIPVEDTKDEEERPKIPLKRIKLFGRVILVGKIKDVPTVVCISLD